MLSGLINTQEKIVLGFHQIKTDGGTQMRAGLNEETVEEYRQKFNSHHAWGDFPPVVVFHDGTDYWLADGFHRVEAAQREFGSQASIHADVRSGTRRDAILYAASANANHGLRRTNADKRRSVEVMLRDEEWAKWSDGEIARRCQVSQPFVSAMRRELTQNSFESPSTRVGADGRVYNTSNIGANRQPAMRRYESGLPAQFGPQPKLPITDWELSDICETVAGEMFGEITRSRVVGLTDAMVSDANAQNGPYWLKLLRSLAPFDAPVARIQAAVQDAAQRMVAERSAPAPVSTMTPEAKALAKEIKAATWGDKPYAEVWEIQNALGRWEHGLTAAELRTLAKFRGGANWFDCRVALGEMRYRDRDLVQALNNIASQMEQRRGGEGETLDPWVAAWEQRSPDVFEARCRRLAEAMLPWAQAWTDDKGRTWRDVVERNPQHANSPFRQELNAECQRRGLMMAGGSLAAVITELFGNLARKYPRGATLMEAFATPEEREIAARNAAADEAARWALANPIAAADGEKPLVDWTEADWANYSAAKDAESAPAPPVAPPIVVPLKPAPDDRIGQAQRLIAIYQQAIGTENEYGELTGCFTETLGVKRELQKLIRRLQHMVDMLEGRTVAPLEECD